MFFLFKRVKFELVFIARVYCSNVRPLSRIMVTCAHTPPLSVAYSLKGLASHPFLLSPPGGG